MCNLRVEYPCSIQHCHYDNREGERAVTAMIGQWGGLVASRCRSWSHANVPVYTVSTIPKAFSSMTLMQPTPQFVVCRVVVVVEERGERTSVNYTVSTVPKLGHTRAELYKPL